MYLAKPVKKNLDNRMIIITLNQTGHHVGNTRALSRAVVSGQINLHKKWPRQGVHGREVGV